MIKMAPVLEKFNWIKNESIVCVTGQNREMLDQILSFMNWSEYDLKVMSEGKIE